MSMEGRKALSFKRYNSQSNQNMMEGATKNEHDLLEDPILEKVPYKLVCLHPLHLITQRSEVVEDLFFNTNVAFLQRGNSDVSQPCGLQQNTCSNISFQPDNIFSGFNSRSQTIDNSYMLTSNANMNMAQQIQIDFQIYSTQTLKILNIQQQHIKNGIRLVCEIDILLLRKFYAVKNKVFSVVNKKLPSDHNSNNVEWIKQRFFFRYSPVIYILLSEMVDKLECLRNQKLEYDYQSRDKLTYNVKPLIALCHETGDYTANEVEQHELLHKISGMIQRFLNTIA